MPTLQEMATKGQGKLARKATAMATSYEAAKSRAVTNFSAVGFGPIRTQAYRDGVAAATYTAPDPAKWARNWLAKMAE